ncbi:MAG: hypothetical protein WAV16_01775 [Candidatus Moraniibacteriota bacterium]
MQIEIQIKDKQVKLTLNDRGVVLAESILENSANLSEKLLLEIDALLRRNDLSPQDIEKMDVGSTISDDYTSVRIAKVVAEVFNHRDKIVNC